MRAAPTIAERFADYAREVSAAPLDAQAAHFAKRALVDYMGALFAGAGLEPALGLARAMPGEVGAGPTSLSGRGLRALPRAAALINGTASHIVELDDIFRDGIYHPGCPTIASAVATAEEAGADGATLLKAIIAGYEVSTRIAAAIQPAHYRYWHTTGTVGTFGAAVAGASVRGLDTRRAAHAIATAGTCAAALQQAFRSDAMSKPLHAGRAAEGGYLAAALAAEGVTGALDILEGEAGFGRAMSGEVDWSAATGSLGERLNIGAITVKKHGCCGHSFAAIDGALALQEEHGFAATDVEAIEVGTYATALRVCGNKTVRTPFEGKFSLAYVVAHALVHGGIALDAYEPDRLNDPEVQRLTAAVTLAVDERAEAVFPGNREALVTIRLRDGRTLSHRQPTRRGDPDAPLSDAEIDEKFTALAAPVIGADAARDWLGRLWRLEQSTAIDFFA